MGETPNLLLLLTGVESFLIFGVQGEFDILGTIFKPLAVFSSAHTTLSYCGDEDCFQARFPRIRGSIRGLQSQAGEKADQKIVATDR